MPVLRLQSGLLFVNSASEPAINVFRYEDDTFGTAMEQVPLLPPAAVNTGQSRTGNFIRAGDFWWVTLYNPEDGNGDLRGRSENLFDSFLGDEDVLTGAGGLQVQWTYLSDLQLEMILTATAKSERVELVTAPRVLVFNTDTIHIQNGHHDHTRCSIIYSVEISSHIIL